MNDDEFIREIGTRIKTHRVQNGLTQIQLADKLNIEDSALRRIESGRTNPTIKTLLNISKALNVDLTDLIK